MNIHHHRKQAICGAVALSFAALIAPIGHVRAQEEGAAVRIDSLEDVESMAATLFRSEQAERASLRTALRGYFESNSGEVAKLDFAAMRRQHAAVNVPVTVDDRPYTGLIEQWYRGLASPADLPTPQAVWMLNELNAAAKETERSGGGVASSIASQLHARLATNLSASDDPGYLRDAAIALGPHLGAAEKKSLLSQMSAVFYTEDGTAEEVDLRAPHEKYRLESFKQVCRELATDSEGEVMYVRGVVPLLQRLKPHDLYWRNFYGFPGLVVDGVKHDDAVAELRKSLVRADGTPDSSIAKALSHIYKDLGADALDDWRFELKRNAYVAVEGQNLDLYGAWMISLSFAEALVSGQDDPKPMGSMRRARQVLEAAPPSVEIRQEAVRRVLLSLIAHHKFKEADAVIAQQRSYAGELVDLGEDFYAEAEGLVRQARAMVETERERVENVTDGGSPRSATSSWCCGDL